VVPENFDSSRLLSTHPSTQLIPQPSITSRFLRSGRLSEENDVIFSCLGESYCFNINRPARASLKINFERITKVLSAHVTSNLFLFLRHAGQATVTIRPSSSTADSKLSSSTADSTLPFSTADSKLSLPQLPGTTFNHEFLRSQRGRFGQAAGREQFAQVARPLPFFSSLLRYHQLGGPPTISMIIESTQVSKSC
jgi:hypothetical protein